MKKNLKIGICLLFIIIIAILLALYIQKNYITQEKIVNLFNSSIKPDNVHIQAKETISSTEKNVTYICDYYYKDNIYVEKKTDQNNSSFYTYKNFNTNQYIYICATPENKEISIKDINQDTNSTFWDNFVIINDNLDNKTYTYQGIEKINEKESYKINFKENYSNIDTSYWIDKENGFVQKYLQNVEVSDSITKYENTYTYFINGTTDDDIKEPNIEDYKDYNINYN